jgi:heme o synthase
VNKSNRILFFVFCNRWSVVSVYCRSMITDYRLLFTVIMRLVKYRLSLMVTFSALTGYYLTGKPLGSTFLILFSGVFFLACGSSALNQWQERNFDLLMERTKFRPLPSGQISVISAFLTSLALLITGTILLGFIGWLPMFLGLSNVVLYNLIYTPLKRFTWLAVIPGSFVGAIPPIIGWTAAGGSVFHPVILFVAGFVLLWQLPHFWLLLIRFGKEYENAGFSSPPVYLNGSRLKNMVFIWAVLTSVFLCSFQFFGINFKPSVVILFVILNLVFIVLFYKLLFGKEPVKSVSNAFILINSFALIVFLVLIFGSH